MRERDVADWIRAGFHEGRRGQPGHAHGSAGARRDLAERLNNIEAALRQARGFVQVQMPQEAGLLALETARRLIDVAAALLAGAAADLDPEQPWPPVH